MTKWIYEYRTIFHGEGFMEKLNDWGEDVVQIKEVKREESTDFPGTGMRTIEMKTDFIVLIKKPKPKEKKIVKEDDNTERSITLTITHLNNITKSQYSITAQSTRKCITARLNEGKTTVDFFDVIEAKYNEWKDTDMAQYLRPETLFGNKFEGYLQYARANKPKEPLNPNMKGMQM